jgi:membrane protein
MMTKPKRFLRQLLDMDVAEIGDLPHIKRHVANGLRFWYRVIGRFVEDKCIQRASALAYASLLAIVPLVALGFSVFTSFQAFNEVATHVRDVLLQYLLPTSQKEVQAYLEQITNKATALSIFGIIGLLFTATALLNTTEEAFNYIWRISRTRPWLSKFMTFWAALTLAPVLLGASITITSYFTALPIIRDVAHGASVLGDIPFLVPWLMSSLALAFLYMLLPNTSVPFRFAIVGGLIAGGMFELTKIGFAFYVTKLAHYELLYGALGVLPIFLIWLYLVWVVVLFGAETAFGLQHPEQSKKENVAFLQAGMQQFFSHLILLRAAEALAHGQRLSTADLIRETGVPDNILQEWLDHLAAQGLLRRTSDNLSADTWVLGQDADRLTLSRIHHSLNKIPMHIPQDWQDTMLGRTLSGLYFRMDREEQEWLGAISLRDLVEKETQSQELTEPAHD